MKQKYRASTKMSPLTKYDNIAPNLEINEILFRDLDPDLQADTMVLID